MADQGLTGAEKTFVAGTDYGKKAKTYTARYGDAITYDYGTEGYGAPGTTDFTPADTVNPYKGDWRGYTDEGYDPNRVVGDPNYTQQTGGAKTYGNVAAGAREADTGGYVGRDAVARTVGVEGVDYDAGRRYSGDTTMGELFGTVGYDGAPTYAGRDAVAAGVGVQGPKGLRGTALQGGAVAGQQPDAGNRYQSYLEAEYGRGGGLPTDEYGRTSYDVAREDVDVEVDRQLRDLQNQIKAQMASQGILDSGVADKQLREAAVELERVRQARKGQLDVAELQAVEENRARLGEQAFAAEQGEAGRALGWADLSLREQGMVEGARQFDNEQAFREWATQQNITDAEADRIWNFVNAERGRGLQRELGFAGLTLDERRIANQAMQFEDELTFREWATQQQITDAEADRIWNAVQQEKDRGLQRELTYADLDLREQQLAQNASQFRNKLEFDTWATREGFNQQQIDRVWQSTEAMRDRFLKGELTYEDLSREDKRLFFDAWKFQNENDFNQWATRLGIDQDRAGMIWQSIENTRQEQLERDLFQGGVMAENDQLRLRTLLERGTAAFGDTLEERAKLRQLEAQSYHAMGAAGQELPVSLDTLRETNPLAYMAYQAGQVGKSLEEIQQQVEQQIAFENSLLANVEHPGIIAGLVDLGRKLELDIPQAFGGVPNDSRTLQLADVEWSSPELKSAQEEAAKEWMSGNGAAAMPSRLQNPADPTKPSDELSVWIENNKGKVWQGPNGIYYRVKGTGMDTSGSGEIGVTLRTIGPSAGKFSISDVSPDNPHWKLEKRLMEI